MPTLINKHLEAENSFIDGKRYQALYQQSINAPEDFWAQQAKQFLDWEQEWTSVLSGSIAQHNVSWFDGAKLNACYNCLDRHLPQRAGQTALIWEGDEPSQTKIINYKQLHDEVCRFANVLKELGAARGERVCIYMPMIPEAIVAMLACARIGAIHSVVFGGFSARALKNRINDAQCCLVVTADESIRGGKHTPLKANVDSIIAACPSVKHVIMVANSGCKLDLQSHDICYHDAIKSASPECPCSTMDANDPLFILYTSGSTGKPKGILHSTGGYLLYAAMTFKLVFNYVDGDIYWCSADIGWITGHSYIVYGPLANGATSVIFAGTPNYPTPARCWQVIDKHKVNRFYTAPTTIRTLMRSGDKWVTQTNRRSLKLLGSVGEPINPEVWLWYYRVVGEERCPIVDTWWQTETGGIMISPLPGATPLKPGAASWPFFGIVPEIVDDTGNPAKPQSDTGNTCGNLVIRQPWPGMLQTVYNDQQRFIETYLSPYPGMYFTGDGAYRDRDGYYWLAGRVDDVINVSGHRLDTAEIESAIVAHPEISEAAVVGYPHAIKGEGICAYVTPQESVEGNAELQQELIESVRQAIGAIATLDIIHWTNDLPKTRSGKIMRRILRKIAQQETEELGDISTLANPEVVQDIIELTKQGKQ